MTRTLWLIVLICLPALTFAQTYVTEIPEQVDSFVFTADGTHDWDPMAMCLGNDGVVTVFEQNTGEVWRVRADGTRGASFAPLMTSALAIAVDDSGFVYLTDGSEIHRYTRDGQLVGNEFWWYAEGPVENITALACDGTNLYLASQDGSYSFISQVTTAEFYPSSSGVPRQDLIPVADISIFREVSQLDCDGAGNVYAVDTSLQCVYRFSAEGADVCLPNVDHNFPINPILVTGNDDGSYFVLDDGNKLWDLTPTGDLIGTRVLTVDSVVFYDLAAGPEGVLYIQSSVSSATGWTGHLQKFGYPPHLTSITDITPDQGGQVRLDWGRSALDVLDSRRAVDSYAVYRRQPGVSAAWSPIDTDVRKSMTGWDNIGLVPARGDSFYSFVAPTLYDSTAAAGSQWSTFVVTAFTEGNQFYDCPADSGYSVDNIAPSVPVALAVVDNGAGLDLTWYPSYAPDFAWYGVYRGATPDFLPADPNRPYATTTSAEYVDASVAPGDTWYYRVAAFDDSGMFSGYSTVDGTQVVSAVAETPGVVTLQGNFPNPFNPRTRISYYVPQAAVVRLEVLDVAGRRVATLVAGSQAGGWHEVDWDGTGAGGEALPSGMYLSRLRIGAEVRTGKMLLNR